MRIIFLIFCLFSFGSSDCNEKNFFKPSRTIFKKDNPEHIKEMELLSAIISANSRAKLLEFKNQDLKVEVLIRVNIFGEYCFKIQKYSNNKEFNETIQNFINEENGKMYFENPIFKSILFTFKSNY